MRPLVGRNAPYLQCFSWHCWLHAVVFFIGKFLVHQLVQPAAHRALSAKAPVLVSGASIDRRKAAIATRARLYFIVVFSSCWRSDRTAGMPRAGITASFCAYMPIVADRADQLFVGAG
jgi:hypothetical protein